MEEKDKIKLKIKALLNKTIENGATEAEAISAMRKANDLMLQYYISEHDLNDPFLGEKIIIKKVSIIHSGYDLTLFYPFLAKLFDCEFFWSKYQISFFGFYEDVDLCDFFYNLIVKSCLSEKDKYMRSDKYQKLKRYYHGRTLSSSFIKGFLHSISSKMHEIYINRNCSIPLSMSLVLAKKSDRVKNEYEKYNFNVRMVKGKDLVYERIAFSDGAEKGKQFHIIQGVNQCKREQTFQLN